MKIIFIGDVFGSAGRQAIAAVLPHVRREYAPDIVFANAENVSGGRGVHPRHLKELTETYGIDYLTSGNHVYDAKEIVPVMSDSKAPLLRPLNYPRRAPGKGHALIQDHRGIPLLLINAMGRTFMEPVDCPFAAVEEVLSTYRGDAKVIVVDFHAETTSDKRAFGWHFNGRLSAVVGTHTHVQTADEEILDAGTAYISDIGMTGPYRSVIGMEREAVIKKYTAKFAPRPEAAEGDPRFCAVYLEIDDHSGKAIKIERIQRRLTIL